MINKKTVMETHTSNEGRDESVSANKLSPDVGRKCHRQDRDTTGSFRH
jgi:hypothetical protein